VGVVDSGVVLQCVEVLRKPADDCERERGELLGLGRLGTVGQEAVLEDG